MLVLQQINAKERKMGHIVKCVVEISSDAVANAHRGLVHVWKIVHVVKLFWPSNALTLKFCLS